MFFNVFWCMKAIAPLYRAQSILSFEGENTVGQQPIGQKLCQLQLPAGQTHRVTTVDAQPSGAGSGALLVFVTGDLAGRKFQEVFQLVPAAAAGQYYIHNDIFRVTRQNAQNVPRDPAQAGQIAMQFVQHYFTTFDGNRSLLQPLYRDSSVLTFEDRVFRGPRDIMQKLQGLPRVTHDGASCTIDVQVSEGWVSRTLIDWLYLTDLDGMCFIFSQPVNATAIILVFITGQLCIEANQPIKFTQVFLLMQEGGANYFVRNDIFRLNYG